MKTLRTITLMSWLLGIPAALAQSPGTVVLGTGPAANSPATVSGAVNNALTTKQDYVGTSGTGSILRQASPVINSPTINSPTLSGTIGGSFGGAFTGGTVDGSPIGATTPSTGKFTNLGATGTSTLSGPILSQIGTSILASGALCNNTTDDAAILNPWLATLPRGTTVVIPAGKMCLIGSASLQVPTSIRIIGSGDPLVMIIGATNATPSSGFYVTPPNQIVMAAASTLENMDVIASGLLSNPTDAQMITQVTNWQSQSSAGVYLPPAHGGVTLRHMFIGGFNTAVLARTAQFNLKELYVDGVNGLVSLRGFDQAVIDGIFAEPWVCLNASNCTGTAGGQNRPGAGFYLGGEGGAQWLHRAFQLGHYIGIVLDRLGTSSKIDDVGSEWDITQGYGTVYNGVGSVGFKFVGPNGPSSATNLFVNGQAIPYDVEGYAYIDNAGYYPIDQAGGIGVAEFWLKGTDNATCAKVTIGGAVHAGDTISITVTSANLAVSPVVVTHTVNADDDLGAIEADLLVRLNTDRQMSAAHFYAQADTTANTVSVYWPTASSATVTSAVTGSLTSAISTTAGLGSAAGVFRNISGPGGVPVLPTFAPVNNVQFLTIDGIPMHTNLIGPGVVVSAVWNVKNVSYKLGPTFSGGISGLALGNSNDAAGLVTEANAATGGTVTFAYTWPWRPNCIVQGIGGMIPLTITAAVGSLTWTNTALSGAQNVRYRCDFF